MRKAASARKPRFRRVFRFLRSPCRRTDEVIGPLIIEDLDLAGVDAWADSAVMIRFQVKVKPLQQWTVKREFLCRLKAEFDRRGIEIPFPHLTLYARQAKDGSGGALPLLNRS